MTIDTPLKPSSTTTKAKSSLGVRQPGAATSDVLMNGARWSRLRRDGASVVRIAASILLLGAAGLGIHATMTSSDSQLWKLFLAGAEWLLAVWLLLSRRHRAVHLVATVTFSAFLLIVVYKAWHQESTCGCFGTLELPLVYTLLLDLVMFIALLATLPSRAESAESADGARRPIPVLGVLLALSPFVGLGLSAMSFASGSSTHAASMMDPSSWPSRPWPILEYVRTSVDIQQGSHEVMLFRHDCPHCAHKIESFSNTGSDSTPLLIEIPPFKSNDPDPRADGWLDPERQWALPSPILLELAGGVVTRVQVQDEPPMVVPASVARHDPVDNIEPRVVEHDFRYVEPGKRYVATLAFTEQISASTVQVECECLEMLTPREQLATGTKQITVAFVPPDAKGPYRKRIFLKSSDGTADLTIGINGRIGLPLRAELEDRAVRVAQARQLTDISVNVINDGRTAVKLLYATATGGEAALRVPRAVIPPGAALEIDGSVKLKAAEQTLTFKIHTNSPEQPILTIDAIIPAAAVTSER